LQSNNTSSAFLEQLETTKHQYGLYNLLNADRTGVYFSSNHGDKCRALRPGLYGLCNASLDTPWPKLRSAKQQLEALLTTDKIDIDQLKALASDRSVVEDKLLPNTGISMAWEKSLSAEFIALESYGTRAKTIILQHHDGHTLVCEQRYNQYGFVSESVFALDLTVFGSARDKFT
jgi:uncharacterized protein with NRDE domain